MTFSFPQFCKGYDEYDDLQRMQRNYNKLRSELMEKIQNDATNERLKADITIKNLFELSEKITENETILLSAKDRHLRGNPPGKTGSYGDAISWECLLKQIPNGEDLYFISDDKDYKSPLQQDKFNTFLLKEWSDFKEAKLLFYNRLSGFFNIHFPEITLASEVEKDLLINSLSNSACFLDTHQYIAELNEFQEFSPQQANAIVAAALTNNQIAWIINDPDVAEFMSNIIQKYGEQIEENNLKEIRELLEVNPDLA